MYITNNLIYQCKALHAAIESAGPYLRQTVEEKVQYLVSFINKNEEYLVSNVLDYAHIYKAITLDIQRINPPSAVLLIEKIERIQYQARLYKIASEPRLLVQWLNEHPYAIGVEESDFQSNPGKVLRAFDALKKSVTPPKNFQRLFDGVVSKMVVSSLKFHDLNQLRSLPIDSELKAIAIGHFINVKPIPLRYLSARELKLSAPYLLEVDCEDVQFKDDIEAQEFVQSCSNAYSLKINSDKITALKPSSSKLQTLSCTGCTSLRELSLSNLLGLFALCCDCCPALKEIALSHLHSLSLVSFISLISLETLSLSNLPSLKMLYYNSCRALRSFTLDNLPHLETLHFSTCTGLRSFTLENLPMLERVDFSECAALRSCVLSNLPSLQELLCRRCTSLETIVSNDLLHCTNLDHSHCPRLRQLPQLPPGATVMSYGSIGLESFIVEPSDLQTCPLMVLSNLGEIIIRIKRMPNIVYLHSEGLDHGGLRRQLATTLLKNLFEERESPLKLLRLNEGVLPLLSNCDENLLKAFEGLGALIALATLGSLPLGRFLYPGFYSALRTITGRIDPIEPLDENIYKLALYGDPNFVLEEPVQPVALPIAFAARGFRAVMRDEDLKRISELSNETFVNRVAGEEITWEKFESLATYRNDTDGKIKEYFKTFFTKYEKNPERVADVIELFTSSRAFGKEEIKIFVENELNKENLFKVATCFQQITVPAYETYNKFEEKLLKTIEHTFGLFDRA